MAEEKKSLPQPEEESDEDSELGGHMSFIDHLEELRTRLVRVLVTMAVATFAIFIFFSDNLIEIIKYPVTRAKMAGEISLLPVLYSDEKDEDGTQEEMADGESATTAADASVASATAASATAASATAASATAASASVAGATIASVTQGAVVQVEGGSTEDAAQTGPAVTEEETSEKDEELVRFISTYPLELFKTKIKISFVASLFLMFPYLFFEAWMFVSPGLYKRERHFILPTVISTWFCFVLGGLFAYFVVLPTMILFFGSLSKSVEIENLWTIDFYFNNAIHLLLAFGVVFEEPVVIALLAKVGLVSAASLRKMRSYVIVGTFVVAAMITPPDPISQLMCAIPLIVLYEASILMVPFFTPKEEPA